MGNSEFGIRNSEFGIWSSEFGIRSSEFGVRNLEFGAGGEGRNGRKFSSSNPGSLQSYPNPIEKTHEQLSQGDRGAPFLEKTTRFTTSTECIAIVTADSCLVPIATEDYPK